MKQKPPRHSCCLRPRCPERAVLLLDEPTDAAFDPSLAQRCRRRMPLGEGRN